MYVTDLNAYTMCTSCMQCPQRPEYGIGYPGMDVMGVCKLICGYLNYGPMKDQEVHFNTNTF